jgi:hypothetical protein
MTARKFTRQTTSFPQEVSHEARRTVELLVSQLQQFRNQVEDNRARMLAQSFIAAHYASVGAQTWTVIGSQVARNTYARIDDVLMWTLTLSGSAVAGTPGPSLVVTLPGGYRCADGTPDTPGVPSGNQISLGVASDNGGASEVCVITATPGNDRVVITLLDGSNWANSAAGTTVAFTIWLDVE